MLLLEPGPSGPRSKGGREEQRVGGGGGGGGKGESAVILSKALFHTSLHLIPGFSSPTSIPQCTPPSTPTPAGEHSLTFGEFAPEALGSGTPRPVQGGMSQQPGTGECRGGRQRPPSRRLPSPTQNAGSQRPAPPGHWGHLQIPGGPTTLRTSDMPSHEQGF